MSKLGRLICFVTQNHKLDWVKPFGPYSGKAHCGRCDCLFAYNHDVRAFLPWDEDFSKLEKMYSGIREDTDNE